MAGLAIKPADAAKMRELRAELDVSPVAIHASYLINVCTQTEASAHKPIAPFAARWSAPWPSGAEFLVLHPGSWKGLTRDEGCAGRAVHREGHRRDRPCRATTSTS